MVTGRSLSALSLDAGARLQPVEHAHLAAGACFCMSCCSQLVTCAPTARARHLQACCSHEAPSIDHEAV